jgi:hypothetical protein
MQWALIGIAIAMAVAYLGRLGWRFLRRFSKNAAGSGSGCGGGCSGGMAGDPSKPKRARLTIQGRRTD